MSLFPFVYVGDKDSPISSSSGGPVRIEDIRKKYNKDNLFVDYDFPTNARSIGVVAGDSALGSRAQINKYKWLRSKELCQQMNLNPPKFAVVQDDMDTERYSEYDLKQGANLGNCWYIASLQALTKRPDLVKFVIPEDNINGFEDDKYCGAFHFRFYHVYACKWVDIVVDDFLPVTYDGLNYSVPFANIVWKQNEKVTEFWPALIEKAYAKFFGDYGKIEGGSPAAGLEDLTGGFADSTPFEEGNGKPPMYPNTPTDLVSRHDAFKRKIQKCLKGKNFACLGTQDPNNAGYIEIKGFSQSEYIQDSSSWPPKDVKVARGYTKSAPGYPAGIDYNNPGFGLMGPHAYTIFDAREVERRDGGRPVFLLKVRNPHGWNNDEWTGPYSDDHDQSWGQLVEDLRKVRDGSNRVNEGEFWVDLYDVMKYFHQLDCCYFGLEDAKFTSVQGVFPAVLQRKAIKIDNTTVEEFQAYKFTVAKETNVEGIEGYGENKAVVCIQLVIDGFNSDSANSQMGPILAFLVYKVEEADLATLSKTYFTRHNAAFVININVGGRSVSQWGATEPGTYIIIPQIETTPRVIDPAKGTVVQVPPQYKDKDIKYAIRLFTENETKLEPIKLAPARSQQEERNDLLSKLMAQFGQDEEQQKKDRLAANIEGVLNAVRGNLNAAELGTLEALLSKPEGPDLDSAEAFLLQRHIRLSNLRDIFQ